MRPRASIALVVFASVCAAPVVCAQTVCTPVTTGAPPGSTPTPVPALVTDRPDFTESSEVVCRGVVQVEAGFTLEGDRTGDTSVRAISTPTVLIRIGVGSRLELRLGGDGFLRSWATTLGSAAESGHSDIEVGAKVRLLARELFGMSVIPMLSIPTNSKYFSSGTYDPTVKFTWASTLPRDFGLSGNVNLSWLSDGQGRYAQHAVSVSMDHDLVRGWGGYWEAYALMPRARGLGAAWTANTGVTHSLGQNMQFDMEAGRGVTTVAPDWFFGFGFALRTPLSRRR